MKHCIIFTKHYRPQDNTWLACAAHGYILYWASNSCHEVIHQETCLSGIRRENSGKGVVVACGTFSLEQSLYNPERVLGQFHNILFRTRSFGSWGGFRAPNNFGEKNFNRPRSIYQYLSMAPRLSGQNCKFSKFPLSLNSQKRLWYKENNTKYRGLTWKPRSHVRILIYRGLLKNYCFTAFIDMR